MLSLFSEAQLRSATSLPKTVHELTQPSKPALAGGADMMTETAQASTQVAQEPAQTATINLGSWTRARST